jgi:hypothetical protein
MTPEQQAAQQLGARALTVCNDLSKAGQLPILPPHPNAGMRAVLGTKEMSDCTAMALEQLRAGKSPTQASDAILVSNMAGSGPNWLLYGGIAAVALVGGAILLTRK